MLTIPPAPCDLCIDVNAWLTYCPNSVLNVKVLLGAFNQEKALGDFSVIVKPMDRFTALVDI